MAKIHINNPRQVINGGAKKYYFKVKGLGGPKGDKGDKGDTGGQGPQGPQGDPCTVVVNSTATLEPGSSAYVTNTGSLSNAVLNFGIPQGLQGPQGAKGDKGDTGAQGETGPRGPQGDRGTNATVTVGTTITTEPGTQAYAWNSSSNPNNAVINFDIPRGATGAQGPQGVQGPIGPAGPAGQNFAPTIVAELPATGDSSKLYLTPKAHTTQTETGNPITATITDGAGKIESFQLDGDTFQQSYTGKNLFPSSVTWTINRAFPNSAQGEWANWAGYYGFLDYIEVEPDTTYTFSNAEHLKFIYGLQYYDSDKNWISGTNDVQTFTTPSNCHYIRGAVSSSSEPTQCQLELGASATSYEPFVGGVPSPNPDYPQPIQTVTGEQTVTINSTAYPISLGSIELCKLGDYQDYIWKDGEDWKVHKEISKVMVDGTIGAISNPSANRFNIDNLITNYKKRENSQLALCDRYITIGQAYNNAQFNTLASNYECCIDLGCGAASVIRFKNTKISTSSDFAAALEANPLTLYYVLATPTDTTITDQTLIAQLEAIRTASLENGANTITNTATGSNLAGDMEIGYYGYNPTNRYDKWLWLDINNNYEQIGS